MTDTDAVPTLTTSTARAYDLREGSTPRIEPRAAEEIPDLMKPLAPSSRQVSPLYVTVQWSPSLQKTASLRTLAG
jgi:hypothetical protein